MALGRLADSMENQTDLGKLTSAKYITTVRLCDHKFLIKAWIAVNNAKMSLGAPLNRCELRGIQSQK